MALNTCCGDGAVMPAAQMAVALVSLTSIAHASHQHCKKDHMNCTSSSQLDCMFSAVGGGRQSSARVGCQGGSAEGHGVRYVGATRMCAASDVAARGKCGVRAAVASGAAAAELRTAARAKAA